MTDKATIQPKSKPEKTTIAISGETSERLEIYCRANGILRKEFFSYALEKYERTGFESILWLNLSTINRPFLTLAIHALPDKSVSIVTNS